MSVPDYQSLMLPALEALSGSVEVPLSKVQRAVLPLNWEKSVPLNKSGRMQSEESDELSHPHGCGRTGCARMMI